MTSTLFRCESENNVLTPNDKVARQQRIAELREAGAQWDEVAATVGASTRLANGLTRHGRRGARLQRCPRPFL